MTDLSSVRHLSGDVKGGLRDSSLEPLNLGGVDSEDAAMLRGHHIATTNGTPDRALADAEDSGSVSGG